MDTPFSKRKLSPEERRVLADRTIEVTGHETDGQRRERDEKTERLRALRLAQGKESAE